MKDSFFTVGDALKKELREGENFCLFFSGEESLFCRFNKSKIRQIFEVEQGTFTLRFFKENRKIDFSFPYTHNLDADFNQAKTLLKQARQHIKTAPEFFYTHPKGQSILSEAPLKQERSFNPNHIFQKVEGLDFVGLYTEGPLLRGCYASTGQKHWFSTNLFSIDYSFFTPLQNAVKGCYATTHWDQKAYENELENSLKVLSFFKKPVQKKTPGRYRCYLAPAAVYELCSLLSWGAVSQKGLMEGQCAFQKLAQREKVLSSLVTLRENFSLKIAPPFNELAEVAPSSLTLIEKGHYKNLLTSTKTAQEYKLISNGALEDETLRSFEFSPGTLEEKDVLKALDTGLYISNLHYLNWSNLLEGKITGMTRYACFWVEKGEIVAPIEDLRFDDSLYSFFGENLENLTKEQTLFLNLSSYGERSTGGGVVPGMLLKEFTFTL